MKKLSTFVAILLSFAITMNAQPVGGKLNKAQKLKVADEQYEMGDYYNALEWYTKVLEEDANDVAAIGRIADTHFKLRDLEEAQKWFEKVVKKDKSNMYPDAEFHYARILKMNGELNDAQAAFEHFGTESDDAVLKQLAQVELEGIQLLKSMAEDEDITVEVTDVEPDEHFFIYNISGLDITFSRSANDVVRTDGNKLGFETTWVANAAGTGNITIQLFHESETVNDDNELGTQTGGSTDIDITFTGVEIQ